MFIKEIIIDGFKSYAKRAVLNNLDQFFNAITGLNGSGKSNILDAICFLLGITTLSHVRVGNIQELIYKNGQSSVTQASVTIIFDNKDKTCSPSGYDTYDEIIITKQIAIGGRNKYLINGCNATNARVSDLFHSINLNINNPHFLIMQGRITKVLNMKPNEILSMLEEAAGTSLYETKKLAALKTIEKKECKLVEIDKILSEEINPQIIKLKEERNNYLESQRIKREIDNLELIVIVFDYKSLKDKQNRIHEELSNIDLKLGDHTTCKKEKDSNLKKIEKELILLEESIDIKAVNKLSELESNIDKQTKEETRCKTKVENNNTLINQIQQQNSQLIINKNELQASIDNKSTEFKKLEKEINKLSENKSKDSHGVQTLSSVLIDKIKESNDRKNKLEIDAKKINSKIEYKSKELEQLTISNSKSIQQEEIAYYDDLVSEVNTLEKKIGKLGIEKDQFLSLKQTIETIHNEINKRIKEIDNIYIRCPSIQFEYSPPCSNFEKNKVYGPLCTLFKCIDVKFITALEATAGGKMFNVVVDSDETSKLLIRKGNLSKRTTFIALNIIQPTLLNQNILVEAEKILNKKVKTAYSLIECDDIIKKSMIYAFGSTIVCDDANDAKMLAYNKRINCRCVTIDGDIFDPSGTLTGGSRQASSTLSNAINIFNLTKEITNFEFKMAEYKRLYNDNIILLNEYEDKSHKLEIIKVKVADNDILKNENFIKQVKDEIEKMKLEKNSIMEKIDAELQNLDTLNIRMKNNVEVSENNEQNRKYEVTSSIERCKRDYESLNSEINDINAEMKEISALVNQNILKIEQMKKELSLLKTSHQTMIDEISELKQEHNVLSNKLKVVNEEIKNKNELIIMEKNSINEISDKIYSYLKMKDKLSKETKEITEKLRTSYEKQNITEKDCKYYTSNGQCYDFNGFDIIKTVSKMNDLKEKKKLLDRYINAKAMNMLEVAEEKYQDLVKKKNIVLSDKKIIQQSIEELDVKKKDTLNKAWECVNKNFNDIFSSMLPNACACLRPPDNHTGLEYGLEIKVGFGSIWKESLNELSGGQRSLVALSLILSMLLFKPAPIYILDEIDAALDISHTQNIGTMFKNHFKKSQFIIVSLKEGMFNNANVLFRTKFVDGSSTITRFQQRSIK